MGTRIFLCHASEDKAPVREVYHCLRAIDGFEPWLDEEDLLPGQEWAREILRTLRTSDFILIFLSRTSVAKCGYVQREMKLALDAWQESPEGTIHTITDISFRASDKLSVDGFSMFTFQLSVLFAVRRNTNHTTEERLWQRGKGCREEPKTSPSTAMEGSG